MQIAGMEVVSVDQLDPKVVSEGLSSAQARQAQMANANADEKAEVSILMELYSAMNNAISKSKSA